MHVTAIFRCTYNWIKYNITDIAVNIFKASKYIVSKFRQHDQFYSQYVNSKRVLKFKFAINFIEVYIGLFHFN